MKLMLIINLFNLTTRKFNKSIIDITNILKNWGKGGITLDKRKMIGFFLILIILIQFPIANGFSYSQNKNNKMNLNDLYLQLKEV